MDKISKFGGIVWATFIRISMDKISKFGGKCPLPILRRFFGAVKITFFKKIGKIHLLVYSYFGTIYSKKKRKPRSIKGIIRQ
jgi:hypothetical protein